MEKQTAFCGQPSAVSTPYHLARILFFLLIMSLVAACSGAPTPTPTPTLTPLPSLTPSPIPTLQPSPTDPPTPDGPPTVTPIIVTVEPLLGEGQPPPIDLTVPEGWLAGYDTFLLNDLDVRELDIAFVQLPLAIYRGPVTGGTGNIIVLWGFSSILSTDAANPLAMAQGTPMPEPDLWSDGLRLLRLAIIEQDCNVGTDVRRTYRIGGQTGVGTQFSAVDCPQESDIRGWFVGIREGGINFVFYVYTDPIDAMNGAAIDELQAILDSVTFRVDETTQE